MRIITRRTALRRALALAATAPALSLLGCRDVIDQACPKNPAESAGIDWIPDVMHPVAHGFQDLGTAEGAPGPVRIWYPTYETFPEGPPHAAPMLKHCLARWPIVLFLHGQAPCPEPNYNRRWLALPAGLARSGYVVVAPQHGALFPQDNSGVQFVSSFIHWVRTGWQHAHWVDHRDESEAVVGHSYGALLAARVVAQRSSVSACVCLSGPWDELNDKATVLNAIGKPTFFMLATGDGVNFENLDVHAAWDGLGYTRYGARFPGQHFDYIDQPPGCGKRRGECSLIKPVAADLVALFLSRYLPLAPSRTDIPVTLIPPDSPLTPKQQFYGGNRLNGIQLIKNAAGCRVDLKWVDGNQTGARQLGP